jgi:hypothetical protein
MKPVSFELLFIALEKQVKLLSRSGRIKLCVKIFMADFFGFFPTGSDNTTIKGELSNVGCRMEKEKIY